MDYAHPVSYLQELMAKQRKDLPLYNFEAAATNSAQNKFICRLHVDGFETVGTGANKQTAKYEAAKQAVEKICNSSKTNGESLYMPPNPNDDLSAKFNYNPVGKLNEITSQQRMSYPSYKERGMDGRNQFIISCQIGDKVTTGKAPTKKNAKQAAAHYMLKLLKGGTSKFDDPPSEPERFPDDDYVINKFVSMSLKNEIKHETDGTNIKLPYISPVHAVKSEEDVYYQRRRRKARNNRRPRKLRRAKNQCFSSFVNTRDEFDSFGDNISMRIRKLGNEESKSVAQQLISTIVFQGEMGFLPEVSDSLPVLSSKKRNVKFREEELPSYLRNIDRCKLIEEEEASADDSTRPHSFLKSNDRQKLIEEEEPSADDSIPPPPFFKSNYKYYRHYYDVQATARDYKVDTGCPTMRNRCTGQNKRINDLKQLDNNTCSLKTDEFDTFGENIASRMRQLNNEKSTAEELINTALFQGEMDLLPTDSNQLASTSTKKYKKFIEEQDPTSDYEGSLSSRCFFNWEMLRTASNDRRASSSEKKNKMSVETEQAPSASDYKKRSYCPSSFKYEMLPVVLSERITNLEKSRQKDSCFTEGFGSWPHEWY